jgi:hypothetical protein
MSYPPSYPGYPAYPPAPPSGPGYPPSPGVGGIGFESLMISQPPAQVTQLTLFILNSFITGVCTTEYHGTTEYQSYLFLI